MFVEFRALQDGRIRDGRILLGSERPGGRMLASVGYALHSAWS